MHCEKVVKHGGGELEQIMQLEDKQLLRPVVSLDMTKVGGTVYTVTMHARTTKPQTRAGKKSHIQRGQRDKSAHFKREFRLVVTDRANVNERKSERQ